MPRNNFNTDEYIEAEEYFSGRVEIDVKAWFLGTRLDLKALEQTRRLTVSPYVIRAGHDGYAVLFRYGAVVLFGLSGEEETHFLEDCKPYVINPFKYRESEEAGVVIDKNSSDSIGPEYITLKKWDMPRLQMIADILAKSAVLSYYEENIADTFDRIEPIASEMQEGGPSGRSGRALLRHIGTTLSIQRTMIGHVEIEGKPDIIRDHPRLERIFLRLEDEYELKERHTALRDKLELIYQTAETMNDLLQYRRTLRAEWYIVFLIAFSILVILYDMAIQYLN